jgi:hypothetical protein
VSAAGELMREVIGVFAKFSEDTINPRACCLASIMLACRCSAEDAERALETALRGRDPRWNDPSWFAVAFWAQQATYEVPHLDERPLTLQRRFVLVPAEGKPTNVISVNFRPEASGMMADGVLRARVLSVKQVAHIKWKRTMKAKERRDV